MLRWRRKSVPFEYSWAFIRVSIIWHYCKIASFPWVWFWVISPRGPKSVLRLYPPRQLHWYSCYLARFSLERMRFRQQMLLSKLSSWPQQDILYQMTFCIVSSLFLVQSFRWAKKNYTSIGKLRLYKIDDSVSCLNRILSIGWGRRVFSFLLGCPLAPIALLFLFLVHLLSLVHCIGDTAQTLQRRIFSSFRVLDFTFAPWWKAVHADVEWASEHSALLLRPSLRFHLRCSPIQKTCNSIYERQTL